MVVSVRTPRLADVDELARINVDTWRDAYTGLLPPTAIADLDVDTYRERWRLNLTKGRPGVSFFVAEVDGVLAAYAIGGAYRPQQGATPEVTGHLGEVFALYTDPPHQRRGAGLAVHDALLGRLATDGYSESALWVLEDNLRSRAWYVGRGWVADGARTTFVTHGQALPEIRMRIGLRGR